MAERKEEWCPECKRRGVKEELLLIPAREGRRQHLYCAQCEREFPCDDAGKLAKLKSIICY